MTVHELAVRLYTETDDQLGTLLVKSSMRPVDREAVCKILKDSLAEMENGGRRSIAPEECVKALRKMGYTARIIPSTSFNIAEKGWN